METEEGEGKMAKTAGLGGKGYDFNGLVLKALQAKASDIHIQSGQEPFFRILGQVIGSRTPAVTTEMINDIKSIVLDDATLRKLEEKGAVDCSYQIKLQRPRNLKVVSSCRLRVSFSKCIEGYKVVCRIVPMDIPTIEKYGMPRVFNNIADQLSGMVIVAGVTGSGKSTTIAAMIERINRRRRAHVVTIEDPVEFVHTPKHSIFTRREIGHDTPDFASGLRTALRQDPDVILVGEMRDLESIRHGLMAAETGHLVFATVHSETASDVPERIISAFPEQEQEQVRYQIADVGLSFIAQQLLRKKDRKGRAAAYEILILDAASRNLIRNKKSHQLDSVMQTRIRTGCITMTRALIDLYASGVIDKESLIAYSPNKERAREYAMEHVGVDTSQPSFLGKTRKR
jgi:twitching motility protein PilT